MPDPINQGQMVFRGQRYRPQGPTLTQQRQALRPRKSRPAQQAGGFASRPATQDEISAWRERSAADAKRQGKSKAEWLNEIYGTGFFKDAAGQGGRRSWG